MTSWLYFYLYLKLKGENKVWLQVLVKKENRIDELSELGLTERLGVKVAVKNVCKMCKYINVKEISHRSHPLREKGLGTNCVKTPPTHSLRPRVGSKKKLKDFAFILYIYSKSTKIQNNFFP